MRNRTLSKHVGWALVLTLCAQTLPALAQSDEQRAGARSLATEGAAAFKEGRFKDAVDMFSKAESLVHAPPHLLYLARAHTKLGQFVKAREAYLKITKEQLAATAPQAFRDAQGAAGHELTAIEPKIGSLSIKIVGGEAAKDLVVKVDDTVIPAVLVGSPQPTDPGDHKVDVKATGFRAQPQMVKLLEGEKSSVSIKLEVDPTATAPIAAVGSAPVVAGPNMPPAAAAGSAEPPPAANPVSDTGTTGGSSGMKIGAYAGFGVGAVGVGLGTLFILKAGNKQSQADDICTLPGGGCPLSRKKEVDQLDDDAKKARGAAMGSFIVGGLGVAAGVTLLVMGNSSSSAHAGIQPFVGLNMAGVAGRF